MSLQKTYSEIVKTFPLILGMRQMPVSSLLFNISWKSQTKKKANKRNKRYKDWEQINCSLFESGMSYVYEIQTNLQKLRINE